jgi:hypothetical protein
MLHTELNAIQHTDGASFATPKIIDHPDPMIAETLTKEMENMAIEVRLAREAQAGPLKSVWDAAVARGRAAYQSAATRPKLRTSGSNNKENMSPEKERSPMKRRISNWWERPGKSNILSGDETPRLPSPSLSPVDAIGELNGEDFEDARLPSPRPSPPPGSWVMAGNGKSPMRRKESYVRGRSISC